MIIDAAQQYGVDLDRVEPGIACAAIPASTSGSRRRRASWAKVSGSSVSSEMLIRLEARRRQLLSTGSQADSVRGQGDVRHRREPRYRRRAAPGSCVAAARHPSAVRSDAQSRNADRDQSHDLVTSSSTSAPGSLLETLGRHAQGTAQIAPVGARPADP